jgi:hypothetical protein
LGHQDVSHTGILKKQIARTTPGEGAISEPATLKIKPTDAAYIAGGVEWERLNAEIPAFWANFIAPRALPGFWPDPCSDDATSR